MYYWLFVCLGLSIGLVGPTLPSLANQTQTLVGDLGAVFTASAVGALLGTLLGGRLFDRVRGHRALGIAQLASAALIALYPVMPSAWLLLVVVIGKGLTDGFINTGANTLLVWTHKEKSSPYMNALHFFFGLGAFLAPILVAQVIDIPGGYRCAFWVLAVFSGLAGLCMLTLKKNPQHAHAATAVEEKTRINYPRGHRGDALPVLLRGRRDCLFGLDLHLRPHAQSGRCDDGRLSHFGVLADLYARTLDLDSTGDALQAAAVDRRSLEWLSRHPGRGVDHAARAAPSSGFWRRRWASAWRPSGPAVLRWPDNRCG